MTEAMRDAVRAAQEVLMLNDEGAMQLVAAVTKALSPHTAAAQAAAVAAAVLAERAEILKLCAAEDTRLNEAADQMHDYHAYDAGNESRARASAISLLSSLIRARTQESGR